MIHEIFYNTITRQSDGTVVLNPRDLFNALKTAYDKGFSAGLSAKSETPAKKDSETADKPADTKPEKTPNITWPWQTTPSPYTIPNQPFAPLPGNPIPTAPGTAPWDRIWYTQYPSITCYTESVPQPDNIHRQHDQPR